MLKKAGFKILEIKKNKNDFKVYFMGECPIDVTGYTVFAWNYSKIKDVYWRKDYSVPSKFLKNFSTVNLFGRKFKCPSPPEEYLTYAYGNWRKPIRTSDKSLYNSSCVIDLPPAAIHSLNVISFTDPSGNKQFTISSPLTFALVKSYDLSQYEYIN